jgi:beta-lactamase class D
MAFPLASLPFLRFGTRVGLVLEDGSRQAGWFVGYDRDERTVTVVRNPDDDRSDMPPVIAEDCRVVPLAQITAAVQF